MSEATPSTEPVPAKAATNYKDTVLLPSTAFPMKADLVKREPERLAKWDISRLYHRIQEQSKGRPKFILHDGPPFANGDVHMGTALNKVLKDLVVKSKAMAGFHAPFIPGWDCHGLPIEFRVVKESAGLSPVEVRKRSEAYARKYIDIQRTSFKRLGVFGDWEKPYLTLDPAYEADIIRTFGIFVRKGLVYRSKRPVLWSYGAQTALAEAEVEYKDKTSPAIYVTFALRNPPPGVDGASLVIWTTTPWTLPANLAIALHPEFEYWVGEFEHRETGDRKKLVIAKQLIEDFEQQTPWQRVHERVPRGHEPDAVALAYTLRQSLEVDANLEGDHSRFYWGREIVKGHELNGIDAQHPFLHRPSKVINALFVTDDVGTGAVHVAPGHGYDDYVASVEHGLEILSPVDASGKFTAECGLPEFVGRHVFDSNDDIIKLLIAKGALLGQQKYQHQYPHCWRSKTPIIFRAVEQFFIRIDEIRAKALYEIDKVHWIPSWGRNRIFGTVESRPDWCISRQRTWGVPLPVFYKADGEIVMEPAIIDKVATIIEEQGTNLWFEKDDEWWAKELGLPAGATRCGDTLDVWIDSGCSHVAVLDRHPELHSPADMYLEATDQHRGWFQSSLMMSVIVRDAAPYKTVVTHGFVVDTSGKKVSKSDQGGDKNAKPMTADHYYNKYGADLVRLWVSSVDYQSEVPFSEELFQQASESYRRIRNTLRVLLGNLHDFDPAKHTIEPASMTLVDRWILERLHRVTKQCVEAYEKYEFRKVFIELNQFCAVDLSALYVDITKDRMYCDPRNSRRRRAAQTAMREVVTTLCRLLAPILAFTADEAWEFLGQNDSVHLEPFPKPNPAFPGSDATRAVDELLQIRGVIQQEIEKARQEKRIGSNLEASVTLTLPAEGCTHPVFSDHETLCEFFILSELNLLRQPATQPVAEVKESAHQKCARCWRYLPGVGKYEDHPQLCGRCREALGTP